MKLKTTHYVVIIGGLIVAGGIVWAVIQDRQPGPADALAQCMTSRGVSMYGAYWCPHCQNQKKLFGNSWQYITYVECALPGGRGQTQECDDAGIKSYPTWVFPGGMTTSGEQSFAALAATSGCPYEENSGEFPVPTGEGMDIEGNDSSSETGIEGDILSE